MDQYLKKIDQKNYKVNVYKSPITVANLSACLPGFGQFYVRDYPVAIILGFMEIVINVMCGLNWSIYYLFTGQYLKSFEVIDWGWGFGHFIKNVISI